MDEYSFKNNNKAMSRYCCEIYRRDNEFYKLPEDNTWKNLSFQRGIESFYEEKRHMRVDSYISSRDEEIMRYLLAKQKVMWGMEKRFVEGQEYEILDQLDGTLGRRYCNKEHIFISSKKEERGRYSYYCPAFASGAQLLLELKYLAIPTNATKKVNSLSWLGTRKLCYPKIGNVQIPFGIEDFWYCEQMSGVNLSVELCAHIEGLMRNHQGKVGCDDSKILETLLYCIEENYYYIADVPAIDWKISAMKWAIQIVFDVFHDASNDNLEEKTQRDALGNLLRALIKNEYPADRKLIEEAFHYEVSKRFNEALCLFTVDSVRYRNVLELNEKQLCHVVSSNKPSCSVEEYESVIMLWTKPERNYSFNYMGEKIEARDTDGDFDVNKYLEEYYGKRLRETLSLDDKQEDVLVFCDRGNEVIKDYIKEAQEALGLSKKRKELFKLVQKSVHAAIWEAYGLKTITL